VKIVPPDGWKPPFYVDEESTAKFTTWQQAIHGLVLGEPFTTGKEHTVSSYRKYAALFSKKWNATHHPGCDADLAQLEEDYWRIVDEQQPPVAVQYAKNINTCPGLQDWSGFPSARPAASGMTPDGKLCDPTFYRRTGWNLNVMPKATRCMLKHVTDSISGVTSPWLYFGSLFSTFCWHTEDHFFSSINYHHRGEPKQWYAVPASHAEAFEQAIINHGGSIGSLHQITQQCNPRNLIASSVPVYRLTQHSGEFIVSWPKGFHMGFSYGWNCTEAVNFATADWLGYGAEAAHKYRLLNEKLLSGAIGDAAPKESVLSFERVLFTAADHAGEYSSADRSLLLNEIRKVVALERKQRSCVPADVKTRVVRHTVAGQRQLITGSLRDYDEKRECWVCKHPCFLSAIICTCSITRVVCPDHHDRLCECASKNKLLLMWETDDAMQNTIDKLERFDNAQLTNMSPAAAVMIDLTDDD